MFVFCLLLSFLFYSPPLRSSSLVEEEEGEKWGRRNERNVASLNGVCGLDREDLNLRIEGGGGRIFDSRRGREFFDIFNRSIDK